MLGVTQAGASPQLPSEVMTSVAQLRAGSEAYERLAIQEPGGK